MAVFEIETTLKNIKKHLDTDDQRLFAHVRIGEPKSAPSERFTAAIFMQSVSVPEVPLAETTEVHTVTIRIYDNMTREPQEDVEFEMAKVTSRVMRDLAGEFDLGGIIRNIDVAGQYGVSLGARWAFLDIDGTIFRICDITVPMIVDGSATLAA